MPTATNTAGMNVPSKSIPQDISEACARANEEGDYNENFVGNLRMERARAADAWDNFMRAANHSRARMEACDSALNSIETSATDQPGGMPMRG